MRDDYKKLLIEYLTNLLNIETPKPTDFDPEDIAGRGVLDYSSNEWQSVVNAFNGKNVSINGILDSPNYDLYIMYGGYLNGDSGNSKSFLIYVDQYNVPRKVRLLDGRGFQFLKFDETNNRVYGVVGDRANNPTANDNDAYFVYYNNLFLTQDDSNPPDLQYSYKIHTDSGTDYFTARDIIKHPEKSWYLIFTTNFSSLINTKVVELQINVGQSNVLNTWNIGSGYYGYAFYGWYNGDTPHFKTIIADSGNQYDFILATDNGSNVSYTNLTCDTTISRPQTAYLRPNYVATSENKIYFVYNASYTDQGATMKQSCIYRYDGTTTIKTCYKTDALNFANYKIPMLNLVNDVNTIYAIRMIPTEDGYASQKAVNLTEHPTPTESNFNALGGMGGQFTYPYRFNAYNYMTKLKRNFNIVYFNSFCGYMREGLGLSTNPLNGFTYQRGAIVQRIGYTGYPYTSYSSLVPRYVNMYYQNVALWFSRNVYNITRFDNTTTASVEIPANYLNDQYKVSRHKLFGNTCYELVRAQRIIDKNKYEIVHVNFINTINEIDEDTNTEYKLGAIKINQNTTAGLQTNYEDTRCIKYRINYTDNTSSINNITWGNINNLNKQTYFIISVSKAIKNIELISNDETTTYMVINGNFEVGKDYLITQKVRIGEKPTSNDLQYNGENVLYSNQQVQVYTQ